MHRGVQQPGHEQQGVTDFLGRQATPGKSTDRPECHRQLLSLASLHPTGLSGGAIDAGEQNEAMQSFDRPVLANQFGGQPVEQFGGYRCGPELPEIVRGFNQPDPEVPLPDAVDDHPAGERVSGIGDPPGQLQPAAFSRPDGGRRMTMCQDGRKASPDFLPQVEVAAATVHSQIRHRPLFDTHHRHLGRGRRIENDGPFHPETVPLASLVNDLAHRPSALEDAGQRVIVRRGDRVELVVVTPCTFQCQPQQGLAHRRDLIVDDVHLHLHRIDFTQPLWSQ